jgi:hypothetical protein
MNLNLDMTHSAEHTSWSLKLAATTTRERLTSAIHFALPKAVFFEVFLIDK